MVTKEKQREPGLNSMRSNKVCWLVYERDLLDAVLCMQRIRSSFHQNDIEFRFLMDIHLAYGRIILFLKMN